MSIRESYMSFHINNGGVSMKLDDRPEGTVLVIQADHFGVLTNRIELPIDRQTLWNLGTFFKEEVNQPCFAHSAHNDHVSSQDYGKLVGRRPKKFLGFPDVEPD